MTLPLSTPKTLPSYDLGPMTSGEFAGIRAYLRLSQADLAVQLQLGSDRTIRYYERGERKVPGPVRILMRLLAAERERATMGASERA